MTEKMEFSNIPGHQEVPILTEEILAREKEYLGGILLEIERELNPEKKEIMAKRLAWLEMLSKIVTANKE
jgi:hypothetical protein